MPFPRPPSSTILELPPSARLRWTATYDEETIPAPQDRSLLRTAPILWLRRSPTLAADTYTNPLNRDPLVRQAFQYFYDLDYPNAIELFERVLQAHPGDPQATALLLEANVFQELYRQDLLDTTFYANDGFLTGKHATEEDPAVRNRIFTLADDAVREADARLSQNPNHVDALYARGWTRALQSPISPWSSAPTAAAFASPPRPGTTRRRVLQLDPDYADAKLVVGVYLYVVGALPLPFKILIGFAGIGGSKAQGMKLLWAAADHGVVSSVEARTVIALFLRREGKYQQAIQVVRGLEGQYPHDYLFALEEANLRKDDGQGMAAVSSYQAIVANAQKPGYYASAQLELLTSASATPSAASATTLMRPRPTSAQPTPSTSAPSSKSAPCSTPDSAATSRGSASKR